MVKIAGMKDGLLIKCKVIYSSKYAVYYGGILNLLLLNG